MPMGYVPERGRKGVPVSVKHTKSAAWVTAIFKASGLSQEAFAAKAKLSRGGLTKMMSGEQRPRFDSVEKLRAVAPPHMQDPENWQAEPPAAPVADPMSGSRATVPAHLRKVLDRYGPRLSYEQGKRLETLATKQQSRGVVLDESDWEEMVLAVLGGAAPPPPGGSARG